MGATVPGKRLQRVPDRRTSKPEAPGIHRGEQPTRTAETGHDPGGSDAQVRTLTGPADDSSRVRFVEDIRTTKQSTRDQQSVSPGPREWALEPGLTPGSGNPEVHTDTSRAAKRCSSRGRVVQRGQTRGATRESRRCNETTRTRSVDGKRECNRTEGARPSSARGRAFPTHAGNSPEANLQR